VVSVEHIPDDGSDGSDGSDDEGAADPGDTPPKE